MAGRGGKREGSGRPAGTPNRRSVELLGTESDGVSPVGYMLGVLHDEKADPKLRAWAAEKAAPFVHPKPAPTQRLVRIDLPATDTPTGLSAAIGSLIAAVAAGELAPSEAQSVAALIEMQRKAIETADIVERLEALEATHGVR